MGVESHGSDACHPHPDLPPSRGKEQYVAALGRPRFSGAFETFPVTANDAGKTYDDIGAILKLAR